MDADDFEVDEPVVAPAPRQVAPLGPAPRVPPEVIGQGADYEAIPRTPSPPQDVVVERGHGRNGVRRSPSTAQSPRRDPPASAEAEEHVIACCLVEGDDGLTIQRARDSGLTTESFYFPNTRQIFAALMSMSERGVALSETTLIAEMGERLPGGLAFLMQVTGKVPTTAHAGYFIEKVRELELLRRAIREHTLAVEEAYTLTGGLEEFLQKTRARVEALSEAGTTNVSRQKEAVRLLDARRVCAARAPKEPQTRLFLAKKPIATPGNLTTVTSKAKTGKTATLGAATAAIIAAASDRASRDCLGFSSPHPEGAIIVVDTEQSLYDAWLCYQRGLKRAAEATDPDYLHHYSLVGYTPHQAKEAVVLALKTGKAAHGSVFILILDGVADLVASVNDEIECNALVVWLRALSVEYDCPIICVIHSNESVQSGDDGRGHLGKQLIRKAESNLILKKSGEITTITSDKQRKAPITEADGVAFQWSDEVQMHVSCANAAPTKARGGRQRLHTIQEFWDVIPAKGAAGKTGGQLHRQANDLKEIKLQTFKDLLADAVKDGLLVRSYDDKTGFSYTRAL